MRSSTVLACYGAWVTAVIVAIYAVPAHHLGLWAVLALTGTIAVVVGVARHRPAHAAAWWLLALTLVACGAGNVAHEVLSATLGPDHPHPTVADALHLASYPLGAAGLLMLVRHRTGGRDRASLLDALSLTLALTPVLWIVLIDSHVEDAGSSWLQRATSIAYPLGDVLLLGVLARLLVVGGRRPPAVLLLGAGTAAMLASDVLHGLGRINGSWQLVGPYDLGWAIFFGAWGAAALHPSMTELTVPVRRTPPAELSLRRLALLTTASLVVPAALLVDALVGGVQHGLMIAVCSAALFLLVLLRLSGIVGRYNRAAERERTLRSAGAALVAATDLDAVAAAVRTAVDSLIPRGSAHRTTLLVPADALDAAPAALPRAVPTTQPSTTLHDVEALDGPAAEAARGFATALTCPLVVRDRPEPAAQIGRLVVAADEPTLLALRGALEVLASLAALAVERVRLTGEMNRRDTEAYFRTLVHHANDVILVVGADGRVRDASPSTPAVLGPGPVVGTPILDLVDPRDRPAADHALSLAAGSGVSEYSTRNYRVIRTDGAGIEVEVAYRDLRGDPSVRGIVLTLRDITEQRRLQRELTDRAFHDALTGLANRVQFQDRVERALTRLGTDTNHVRVGVLLLDLDDFSLVNDAMGHATGDELLLAVARRLTDMLEPPHTVARLSGDEFAVLVDDVEQGDDLEQLAAHIVGAFDAPLALAGGLATSVSVGLASAGAQVRDVVGPAELLRRADLALRAAKEAGKNRWCRYEADMGLAAIDRAAVRTELRHALDAGEFQLRYQPIVELGGGRTIGFEALVRWTDPRGQAVPPAQFIPIAEQTGLILPLGAWVLDRALSDLAGWRRQTRRHPVRVNVNISAHQVRGPDFVAQVLAALARHDTPAQRLVLEITETALLADDQQVTTNLAALRQHGIRIALDDFGTGFASLDYLRVHAVDSLKIDRSFVDGMESSPRQTALVRTIVHLAHALDLPVVAEGVETPAQRDALLLVGCRLAQGYLFSPPITAEDARHWLENQTVAAAVG